MIVLKRHLTPDRKSLPLEGKVQEQLLPVLSTDDRRAFLHARWSPFLPESIWQIERRQRAGTAQIYLDVSGSMSAEMPELIALLPKLRRLSPSSHFVFVSKEGAPLSVDSIQFIVRRAGERAGLPFRVHPHMLRHACGHYLINTGRRKRDQHAHRAGVPGPCGHQEHGALHGVDTKRFRDFWK